MTFRLAVVAQVIAIVSMVVFPTRVQADWFTTVPEGENQTPWVVQVEQREPGLVTVHVQIRRFEVTEVGEHSRFGRVTVPGWGSTREPGKAELPIVAVPLLLDSEAVIVDVRSKIRAFQPLTPAPFAARPKRCESGQWRTTCDTDFYSSSEPWPAVQVALRQQGAVRRAATATLVMHPFRFVASQRLLEVSWDLEVDISSALYQSGPAAYESVPFFEFQRASFFSRARLMRSEADAAGLLVIAHDSMLEALDDYVDWKSSLGFEVSVVPLSEVGSGYQQVQSFIQQAYDGWQRPPSFVLLVGDGEGAGTVPFVPSSYGCASDFLYSTLDGDDLHSDVFVGRMSVHTVEEARVMVAKALWYESAIESQGDSSWLAGSVCISSSEGEGLSNDDYRSDIICDLQSSNGYCPVDKLYHSLGNDTASNISASLEEGRGYLTYLGHGSGASWATTTPPYGNSHVQALANAFKLPFVVDVSCSNGGFDSSGGDCFAEVWSKTGSLEEPRAAVGIYSASTPAAWDEPAEMAVGMAHALLEQGVNNWGALAGAGRAHMLQVIPQGSSEETCHQYVLFGDPSLSLRTRKAMALEVSHPAVIPLGGVDVEFLVQTGGNPVTGATVSLEQGEQYLVLGKTDESGTAVLYVDAPAQGTLDVTVFAADSLVYQATLETLVPGCGILQVSPAPANCDTLLTVVLFDSDLNLDPGKEEVVAVQSSTDAGAYQDLVLKESGADTGKFTGQLQLSGQPGPIKLQVSHGDQITMAYEDSDCEGESVVVQSTVGADCEAPVISQVSVEDVKAMSVVVGFGASEKCLAKVAYGKTTPEEGEAASGGLSVSHLVQVNQLAPDTEYVFKVVATDEAGNAGVADNGGELYQFKTLACLPACVGKKCGPDGCGGVCGQCCELQTCQDGVCVGGPGCESSGSAGCGGCSCEDCVCDLDPYCCQVAWDDLCVDECISQCGGCNGSPDCGTKECGPDGCGGECGPCPAGWTCTDEFQCVAECLPECEGKDCGSDGCGASCGDCQEEESCEEGLCLAPCSGYSFEGCCVYDVLHYCDEGFALEVDCSELGLTCGWKDSTGWYDCVEEQKASGKPEFPLWCPGTCPPQCEGKECGPDGCGGQCGQCGVESLCENGVCVPECKAQCDEQECGDNGCGGLCGECLIGEVCEAGKCLDACVPQCEGRQCGPDSCGHVCGTCAPGMVCSGQFECVVENYEEDVVEAEPVETVEKPRKSGGCSTSPVSSEAVVLLLLATLVIGWRRRIWS